jgi:very-short-patch-repair endonuclease
MCAYYAACVRQEAGLTELLPRGASASYLFPRGGREDVVTGRGGLVLDGRLRQLAEATQRGGDALLYGFPVLVALVPEERRSTRLVRRLAPLFVIELALPDPGQPVPDVLSTRGESPTLHLGTMAQLGYTEEQTSALLGAFPIEPHLGNTDMGEFISKFLDEIGAPLATSVNVDALDAESEGGIDGTGIHNVAIVYRSKASQFYAGLLGELADLAERGPVARGTAASFLGRASLFFPDTASPAAPRSRGKSPAATLALPLPSNDAQSEAVEASLARPLTVVTGPPGTGKSQLVANVVASHVVAGQTVLVASTNNGAVDVAVARLAQLWEGLVVRTGNLEHREKAGELVRAIGSRRPRSFDVMDGRARLQNSWVRVRKSCNDIDERTDLEDRLARSICEATDLEVRLTGGRVAGIDLARRPAAAWSSWGRRVGRARYWFPKLRCRRFLADIGTPEAALGDVMGFLEACEQRDEILGKIRWLPDMERLWEDAARATEQHRALSRDVVTSSAKEWARQGAGVLRSVTFRSHFDPTEGRSTGNADVRRALGHLRGWATTALSASGSLPLSPGLFDLVIIDEASQCSIPAILPLLYRARRALIIGDPMQLSHICTLTRRQDEQLAKSAGLDSHLLDERRLSYRQASAYDALEAVVGAPLFLAEHYRSHPHLVALVNRRFYSGSLVVLTDRKRLTTGNDEDAVRWMDVRGHVVRPPSGSAVNEIEAEGVVECLEGLLVSLPHASSVGVVTPFGAQARRITELVDKRLPEAGRHVSALRIGTAHRFQGDERDVVVFSPVVSDGLSGGGRGWLLGTENLFNVAITRARSRLIVVGDRAACRASGGVLAGLADDIAAVERGDVSSLEVDIARARGDVHSRAEELLMRALVTIGVEAQPKVRIAGYECDFVVRGRGVVVNLECDGWQHLDAGGRLRRQDHARDEVIEGMGVTVVRVPAWRCLLEPDVVAQEVRRRL